jgi:hypothetical protein
MAACLSAEKAYKQKTFHQLVHFNPSKGRKTRDERNLEQSLRGTTLLDS